MQKQKLNLSNAFLAASLAATVAIVYFSSFTNKMFWDDNDFILNNQYVKNWSLYPHIWKENIVAGAGLVSNYFRPVLSTVFAVEWHLWQAWAPGWHIVNTAFHAADAVLLFFLILALFKKRWLAFCVAIIFALHPIQTEAVTYVNSLGDSLSVFFVFGGLLAYLKIPNQPHAWYKNWKYYFALACYALALLTKEISVIMPALLILAEFHIRIAENVTHNSAGSSAGMIRKIFVKAWPFLGLAAVYIALRATIWNFQNTFNLYGSNQNSLTQHIYVRIFTFFHTLIVYLGLIFWPNNLHMERSVSIETSFFASYVIAGFLVFAALLILAFSKYKKYPILAFGILWFFIGLAPTSNIAVPINGLIYEHWLYLPLIGIVICILWLASELIQKIKTSQTRANALYAAASAFTIILILFSWKTIARNTEWSNPITFYNQTLEYAPNSYRVINNLGMAYADANDFTSAISTYNRAVAIDPKNPVAYHNLGNAYLNLSDNSRALQYFLTAVRLDPHFLFSYGNIVNLYLQAHDYASAKDALIQYENQSGDKSVEALIQQLPNQLPKSTR